MKELESHYAGDGAALARELEKKKGFVFQANWYRVVLDEAHAIKNLTSRSMGSNVAFSCAEHNTDCLRHNGLLRAEEQVSLGSNRHPTLQLC